MSHLGLTTYLGRTALPADLAPQAEEGSGFALFSCLTPAPMRHLLAPSSTS